MAREIETKLNANSEIKDAFGIQSRCQSWCQYVSYQLFKIWARLFYLILERIEPNLAVYHLFSFSFNPLFHSSVRSNCRDCLMIVVV